MTISIHADPTNYYPFFTGYPDERGNGTREGFNLNLPLMHGSGGGEMMAPDWIAQGLSGLKKPPKSIVGRYLGCPIAHYGRVRLGGDSSKAGKLNG